MRLSFFLMIKISQSVHEILLSYSQTSSNGHLFTMATFLADSPYIVH